MPIASITRIINNARTHLPGSIDSAIQYELFSVLDEFFKETGAWRDNITFNTNTTRDTYQLVPPSGTIVRLIEVLNEDDIPQNATMPIPGELIFPTLPQAVERWTATVILTVVDPTKRDGLPEFPNWVSDLYHEGITDGLIARMLAQPAKPYSNERLGIYRLRRFRNVMAKASADVQRQNLFGAQNWKFPKFA